MEEAQLQCAEDGVHRRLAEMDTEREEKADQREGGAPATHTDRLYASLMAGCKGPHSVLQFFTRCQSDSSILEVLTLCQPVGRTLWVTLGPHSVPV